MTDPARAQPMTEAEYLEFERQSEVRHEFEEGFLRAMSGGQWEHNEIVFNLKTLLKGQAYPRGCKVSTENIKVRAGSRYYYPDVVLTCEEVLPKTDTAHAPCAIFEVLSPSTESHDKGGKFRVYTTHIPSLEQYFLVSSEERMVEVYTHASGGIWAYQRFTPNENTGLDIPVRCVDGTLTLEQVYVDTGL